MTNSLVIIPTYNEQENLLSIVNQVLEATPDSHLLIVDDNSPDGTGILADNIAAKDNRIFVLHRFAKNGLGPAYIEAFNWGLKAGYKVLVEMDADGSHPAEVLPKLITAVTASGTADLAIGSRWVKGGSVVNWPIYREIISRAGSIYARIMLQLNVRDATAGYRAFKSSTLNQIDLSEVDSKGYCFQIDMTRRVQQLGLQIVEIPITFREREFGVSKMNSKIVVEAILQVTVWGFQRLFNRK